MSNYFFAQPSLIEGMGRNIDFFGILNCYRYNGSLTGREADLKAMRNDINILKRDFEVAYGKIINGDHGKKQ